MKRIQLTLIVALTMLLCTGVHGQEATTRKHPVSGSNTRKGTARTQRGLGRDSSSQKRGKAKGKGGKAVPKKAGKSNSQSDTGSGTDFFGFQQVPQQPQEGEPGSENDDDSITNMPPQSSQSYSASSSESESKKSKKSKKSRKSDTHKTSHKLSKKSRSSSSSKGHAPSPTSHPMIPSASPTLSPTRDGATDPTTPSPTTSGSTFHLTHFALEYTITEDDRIPFRSELLEVVELTRAYLATYFQDIFDDNDDISLTEFITVFTDTQSDFGDPVYIAYRSSAIFASDGAPITVQELDLKLKEAFADRNLDGYLGMLQALAPSNLFSTTTFVAQVDVREERQSLSAVASVGIRTKTSANGQNAMAGVAAGVAGVTLMGAAGLFFNSQRRTITQRPFEKYDGDATSFTTGTWSLDQKAGLEPMQSSGRHSLT